MNAFEANKLAKNENIQKRILDKIHSNIARRVKQKICHTFIDVTDEYFDADDIIAILKELGKDGYYASCSKRKNEKYEIRYEFYISWNKPMKRTVIEHEDRCWSILPEQIN